MIICGGGKVRRYKEKIQESVSFKGSNGWLKRYASSYNSDIVKDGRALETMIHL